MGRNSIVVVAEPGCTAEGQQAPILEMIDVAARAGADVFKAQWTSDPVEMAARRGVGAKYERFYRWLAFPLDWHAVFAARCQDRGIRYACTVYIPWDAARVAPYVSAIKIASFESGDWALVNEAITTEREVWVSTGMLDADQLDRLATGTTGNYPEDVTLLHCVSSYPAPVDQLGLGVLRHGRCQGFSDHSDPALTWTGALAVAAGAELVEAHIRLDGADPSNPDVPHAMIPRQFTAYVRHIRFAEACLGDGEKRQMPCEAEMAQYRVGGTA